MEPHSSKESMPRTLLRPLVSPVLRTCYGLLNRNLRGLIGGIPGALPVYHRFVRPLMFPPQVEPGLVLVRFPDFSMLMEVGMLPGEVSIGKLWDWEPATTFVFRELVRPGDVVIDVGANLGYFTALAATLCGPQGKVFAFEPHPKTSKLLSKNIAANKLANVVIVQKAVSDQSSTANLFLATRSDQHSMIHEPLELKPEGARVGKPITVDTITLDEFLGDLEIGPRLLKMDIEGAEPLALRGAEQLISQNPEMAIILELNTQYLNADAAGDLLKKLASYGFKFMVVDDEADQIASASCAELMQRFLSLGKWKLLNLFCARDEGVIARMLKSRA